MADEQDDLKPSSEGDAGDGGLLELVDSQPPLKKRFDPASGQFYDADAPKPSADPLVRLRHLQSRRPR